MANKKDVYVPTVGEEIANTVTHGVMSLVALVALPFAAVWAYVHDPNPVTASVSVSIFALSVIGGWQGIFITILQWAMVLFGIFYKSLSRNSIPAISLTIYLVMGWTIVFFLPLFVRQASTALLVLIAAGGVLYTLGAWFYARQGFRYHHMVWHLLINLAVVAHFIGIVFFLY